VRIAGLVLGFALAIAATLAVFLTDNALYLRLAVIAVAWAFVIAAFSAGRRKTDQAVAEGRENQLRQAYSLELEREVAARREYELKLENQLRRETQEAMRAEMDKLRADLASLAGLRDQLVGLGELQADMGRLRHELTEQLSGEMLVERIVMRTQSIRMPAERAELGAAGSDVIDGDAGTGWSGASRAADDDLVARVQPPPVPSAPDRPATEPPSPFAWLAPRERPAEPPSRHASPTQDDRVARPDSAARHGTAEQPAVVQVPVRTPPSVQPPAPPAEPPPVEPAPPVRSEPASTPGPATELWAAPEPEAAPHRRRAPEEPAPPPAEPEHEPDVFETAGRQRLTEILAESGSTAGGGRRRRRYREDDDPGEDDVLARVLSS
jgi:hypothetical protein